MEDSIQPDPGQMRSDERDKLTVELYGLVNAACDNVLSEAQTVRLNQLLSQDAGLRSAYLRFIAIHSALTTTAGSQAFDGVTPLQGRRTAAAVARDIPWAVRHLRGALRSPLLQAAVFVAVLVTGSLYWLGIGFGHRNVAARRVSSSTGSEIAVSTQVAEFPAGTAVSQWVRVNRVSPNALWQDPNDRLTVDTSLAVGNTVSLAQGEIELVYDTGVKLLLIGPCEFVMREGGGGLRRGSLVASVPEAGQGFTIVTPNGRVVDLGTEFGVVVDDFGVSEVSVFKGKVEAFPKHSQAPESQKIELAQGRALQWSRQMIRLLDVDPQRLSRYLASINRKYADEAFQAESPSGDAVSVPSEGLWMALGDVTASREGFTAKGSADSTGRPYLLSTREFDMSDGPVTVICDIRFPQLAMDDDPSFAILTRSENEKSAIARPWKDILATCVRCSFGAASGAVDGLLETATKFERDRELTSISWRGFQRPQQDTPYRLVMRDDGVNVSFTVSEVNHPSIIKTVVCRSIFRGYKNHVALEGWAGGQVVIDSVRILQSASVNHSNATYSHFAESPEGQDGRQPRSARDNDLLRLVPDSAALVVEDSFDQSQLDRNRWKTLGEVELENGCVSLGRRISTRHIDTFHPRPYLLTTKQFTPRDGKLYVLGEIEFDENFRQGYGGSFAVMSRCVGEYGEGPDWTISALRTGIRCNLWPAAPWREHILEIHQRATPSTVSLLKGESLEIDPQSRTYFFCMEDDGERVAITFQDVDHPAIYKTIAHDATSQSLRSGLIAFESCWGSRIGLDNIRIYVQENRSDPEPD
jgi:hypothetical protein